MILLFFFIIILHWTVSRWAVYSKLEWKTLFTRRKWSALLATRYSRDLNLKSRFGRVWKWARDARYEPEFLIIARVVFVLVALLGGGYGRRLRAFLLVQGPRAVIVLRGTFLVALLTALLVEPQREALTEFLQHALLLALRAMRSILTSAGGHIDDIQDGRRFLQPGMADQRNRGLGQGMLGRHVPSPRPIVLFVPGPLSAASRIFGISVSHPPFTGKVNQVRGIDEIFNFRDKKFSIFHVWNYWVRLRPTLCRFVLIESYREFIKKKSNFLYDNELNAKRLELKRIYYIKFWSCKIAVFFTSDM